MKQLFLSLLIASLTVLTPHQAISSQSNNNQLIVALDLHGVVVTTNKQAAFKLLGARNLLKFAWEQQANPLTLSKIVQKRLYDLMSTIKPQTYPDNTWIPHDDNGNPIPQFMQDLLDGSVQPLEILEQITNFAQNNPNWFKSKTESTLLINLAKTIFTPTLLAQVHQLRPEAVEFVKECKAQGIRVAILSNWDAASFECIKQKYPDFFDLFNPEDICISGKVGHSKPAPAIYAFFNTLSDKPENIWFIDDQEVNLIIPKEMGVHTIHYKAKKWLGGLYTKFPPFPTIKKATQPESEKSAVLVATQD